MQLGRVGVKTPLLEFFFSVYFTKYEKQEEKEFNVRGFGGGGIQHVGQSSRRGDAAPGH